MAHVLNFEAAARAADLAANATSNEAEMAAVMGVLAHREELQIALTNRALARFNGAPPGHRRLPLRDEGHEFGRVEARIPDALYFGLRGQKNFGEDGLFSDEGMRDVLKAYPCCRVETVSGKTTVGYMGKSRKQKVETRNRRWNFGRGTLDLTTS